MNAHTQIVEALLFAAPDPLKSKVIAKLIRQVAKNQSAEVAEELGKIDAKEVEKSIHSLNVHYEETGRAFAIMEKAHGWKVLTKPEYASWVRELYAEQKPTHLSLPALETLAIIAYRQPLTKADIEAVRGVDVSGVVQKLLDKGLIKIAGRAEVPGKPLLYETTDFFLDHFGIKHVRELPNADELSRVELPESVASPKSEVSNQESEVPEPTS